MDNIKIFESKEFGTIRTIDINNEVWFVGKDVAEILGYKDTSDALKRHVDNEDKLTRCFTDSGQNREKYIINESGLYSLILSSKLPSAKKFKRWVTSEVLPSIRKHGAYAIDEILENPDMAIKALTQLKEEREKRKNLEKENSILKPKALFADAVSASSSSILIGDLAKLLKQNHIDIGQKRLFEKLRDEGFLMSQGSSYNMPTQKSMDLGLFQVKERTMNNPDGSVIVTRTTLVTGKGQIYFINRYLKQEEVCHD